MLYQARQNVCLISHSFQSCVAAYVSKSEAVPFGLFACAKLSYVPLSQVAENANSFNNSWLSQA